MRGAGAGWPLRGGAPGGGARAPPPGGARAPPAAGGRRRTEAARAAEECGFDDGAVRALGALLR
ncbi:hypothetical protein AAHZ94_35600, partial [Streptomyces sp. HSW2009]|uniref:hypothetical protein n=1 Tax=Streptomyces sp. HSW2009 TaxID=3142890 RepID=UPI0032ED8142